MLVVVSYDVSTTTKEGRRRLRKVAKECLNWGQRVQNSVFECVVDAGQWAQLRHALLAIYEPTEDSLRFYFLGNRWRERFEHYGTKRIADLEAPLLV